MIENYITWDINKNNYYDFWRNIFSEYHQIILFRDFILEFKIHRNAALGDDCLLTNVVLKQIGDLFLLQVSLTRALVLLFQIQIVFILNFLNPRLLSYSHIINARIDLNTPKLFFNNHKKKQLRIEERS